MAWTLRMWEGSCGLDLTLVGDDAGGVMEQVLPSEKSSERQAGVHDREGAV